MEFSKEYLEFVKAHASEDPVKLRLRFHGDDRRWIPLAINNIAILRKSRKFKLNDEIDLTPRVIPLEVSAQQATSAPVSLLHANLVKDATLILDMTFGLGMDSRLIAVDMQKKILGFDLKEELVAAAKVNFEDFPNVEVYEGDSVKFLQEYVGKEFDLIIIDPARRGKDGERLYNLHDCQPDLIEILPLIMKNTRQLMAKLSPMLDVTQTLRDLPGLRELHIVEEGNECKELLAIVDRDSATDEPLIIIDRISKGGLTTFMFKQSEEKLCNTSTSTLNRHPQPGDYLLEPSAATMKAAPFNLLASRFNAIPLHRNTHLYLLPTISTESIPTEFPGTIYKIEQALPLTSSNLKQLAKSLNQADIAVRNVKGFTPDTLRKRLKLKPGGDLKLYAATLSTTTDGEIPFLLLVSPASK